MHGFPTNRRPSAIRCRSATLGTVHEIRRRPETTLRLSFDCSPLGCRIAEPGSAGAIHQAGRALPPKSSCFSGAANVRILALLRTVIALAHGCGVVTNNRGEYERVPGLRVEDWTG